jgi:hypothetical protein
MKSDDLLPKKKLRRILEDYLTSHGWEQESNGLAPSHDVTIKVKRGAERWVIEMRGAGTLNPEITSSFVAILGRVLQRMDEKNCKYSIALPDTKPFRRLWERLPALAKNRTGITVLFVGRGGAVDETAR